MLKEAIKLALRIFVIGLIATFLFHIINKDLTWTNFALALVVDMPSYRFLRECSDIFRT
jgi:hypothetical protein